MASIVRYAIAIASSLENAGRVIAELLASKLQMERIAIIGEEKSFATSCCKGFSRIAELQAGASFGNTTSSEPERILSLGDIAQEVLPSWARRNAMALRHSLDRWLAPAHSRRLSLAVDEGAFLIWVELKTVADEQIATRCLLRSSDAGVAVHDFFLP